MEEKKELLWNPSLPPTLECTCFLVSLRLEEWYLLAHSPKCLEAILEPKGAGTGQVVTYQVANPFWNEGRFTWSLLSWRECPRNEIFKSHWWQRLTPALGSSERPSSVWKRKEWSSSIEKQSWLQPDEVKAAFCDGREVGRRHVLGVGVPRGLDAPWWGLSHHGFQSAPTLQRLV